jgi:alkylhydroperoxidase family enzyme
MRACHAGRPTQGVLAARPRHPVLEPHAPERGAVSPPRLSRAERAALSWTECLTLVASRGAPDAEYEALTQHFAPAEIVNLTALVGLINLWSRLAIGLRAQHRMEASHAT